MSKKTHFLLIEGLSDVSLVQYPALWIPGIDSHEFPADWKRDDGETQGFWIVAQVTRAQCHLTSVRINLKSVSQNALSRVRPADI